MKQLIESTQAYIKLDSVAKLIVNKREVRTQIEDAVIQAKNIGIAEWKKQSPLLPKHQNIVEEIVKSIENGKN